jgi:hypothetical protein
VITARNECISNLNRIYAAKQIWALDMKRQKPDLPGWSDLQSYFRPNGRVSKCPSGGTYTIGSVTEKPKCGVAGHVLF